MGSDELMRRAMADSNHVIQRNSATGDGGAIAVAICKHCTPLKCGWAGCPVAKRESRIQRLMSTFELAGILTTREQAERAVDDASGEPIPEF